MNDVRLNLTNIDPKRSNIELVDGLTPDHVKIKYNWLLNAKVKDALVGEDSNGLVWYAGTWECGEWMGGTWYSGEFWGGLWKTGHFYSYRLDRKDVAAGVLEVLDRSDDNSLFLGGTWQGGTFHGGTFAPDVDVWDVVEGFDGNVFPPPDWQSYIVTGTTAWSAATDRVYEGSGSAKAAYPPASPVDHETWLISPAIPLGRMFRPTLKYHENVEYGSYAIQHKALISTSYDGYGDPGTHTWTTLKSVIATDGVWTENSFELSAYTGTAYVAFKYVGNDSSNWWIDSFSVKSDDDPTLVEEDGFVPVWEKGDFLGGIFRDSLWKDGNSRGGSFIRALWLSGNFFNGTFTGTWRSGTFYGGNFESGTWVNGTFTAYDPSIPSRFGTTSYTGTTVYALRTEPQVVQSGNTAAVVWTTVQYPVVSYQRQCLWSGGTFKGGEFYAGRQTDSSGNTLVSARHDVTQWLSGSFEGGRWYGGQFLGGDFWGGTWFGGVFGKTTDQSACTWRGGEFRGGTFLNGGFLSGTFSGGLWVNGTFFGGTISD